jgi:hypothetical protein
VYGFWAKKWPGRKQSLCRAIFFEEHLLHFQDFAPLNKKSPIGSGTAADGAR